ncbi:Reductase [Handroanthus impetiginosus]|uniref:Reductase n=1 Tax=Handroanthus impetiginosus TaxID=429701 RepID=A0A2G9I5L3_9LAMI|nr:Reductase [Handroanthus impetiginosus]
MESKTRVANELEPWLRLENKVVMVTGASSGLGREFCLDLAKAGCRVIATARRMDRLRSPCDEINDGIISSSSKEGSRDQQIAVAVEIDLDAGGRAMEASVQKIYIVGRVHTPLDLSEEEWNDTVRTNLSGTWLVSKCVCMRMRDAKKGGSVISISSIAGLERGQLPGGLVYACTKAAVNTMTKIMALELGVNSISPGLFKSEITHGLVQKDWLKNVERRTVPLRNFGTSDPALASVLRYLIHDLSEHVTGNLFIVNEGTTLPGVPIFSSL